jgi:hypothetical protein
MPSRRAVLAGLLSVGTGCTDRLDGSATARPNGSDDSTDASDRTDADPSTDADSSTTARSKPQANSATDGPVSVSMGESTTLGETRVAVGDPRHRFSALTVDADTADVVTFDERLLLVSVSARGEEPPPRSAFAFTYDGQRYDSYLDDGESAYQFYHFPDAYVPGEREGWIGFEVPGPIYTHQGARFVVEHAGERAAWPLPGGIDVGSAPPAFELVAFETPEKVKVNEAVTATVTVKNAGGPGAFRGAVNLGGVLHSAETFAFEVPNGETKTAEVLSYAEERGKLHLSLVGTGDIETERRTVTIE